MWAIAGIAGGRCKDGTRVRRSQAVGGAASQLGPRALALAAVLNKQLGLPYGKTVAVLAQGWGLQVSRDGLCRALARLAEKAAPTYRILVERIRGSPSVTPDETGRKVGGRLWWMWEFSSPEVTVYAILPGPSAAPPQPGRGFEQAAAVLGGLSGARWLERLSAVCARHASDAGRCIEVGGRRSALFPRAVRTILQSALGLRERRDHGQIS